MYFPMFPRVAAPKIVFTFLDISIMVKSNEIKDVAGHETRGC